MSHWLAGCAREERQERNSRCTLRKPHKGLQSGVCSYVVSGGWILLRADDRGALLVRHLDFFFGLLVLDYGFGLFDLQKFVFFIRLRLQGKSLFNQNFELGAVDQVFEN